MRHDFLKEKEYEINKIALTGLSHDEVRNRIESYIGSVEIPVGLIGPVLLKEKDREELVYGGAATLEGALVASMNRGAKAASLSGGISTKVVHQRMTRCPMFTFQNNDQANQFARWVNSHFPGIKKEAEMHSNHAQLLSIDPVVMNAHVHTRFYYTTGDASGQNMTTTCTWHAMLYIVKAFEEVYGSLIQNYIIEGNGSSDKKVSKQSVNNGRGVHTVAECHLQEAVINKVLRTTSEAIMDCYAPSVKLAKEDCMFGYNINVANAVAAIYAATGQDLACIHESAVANLHLEKTDDGLFLRLTLPCLVIGTVGGGTSLPKQHEVLKLMKCDGKGKVQRFAQLIAAFALSLEISTYAAIVSGEFAKAHEKLGRNKPVNWLTKSELNQQLVARIIKPEIQGGIVRVSFEEIAMENGIVTNITGRTTNKLIGFFPFKLWSDSGESKELVIKSKATDIEVIKGLHAMAASIDTELSDLIFRHRSATEYHESHRKELVLYERLAQSGYTHMPTYYGRLEVPGREIYLFITELLSAEGMKLFNSENSPEKWAKSDITSTIEAITEAHRLLKGGGIKEQLHADVFNPEKAKPLYTKLIDIVINDEEDPGRQAYLSRLPGYLDEICSTDMPCLAFQTIVHNDFNPRNVGVRVSGEVCIYDWELAVRNIPHRDIVEFVAFTSNDPEEMLSYLAYHANQYGFTLQDNEWIDAYSYSVKEFICCRLTFYKAAEILMKLKFPDRVMKNACQLAAALDQLKQRKQDEIAV
jgi:hydroxymethylglutaryl-CoA reductase (NADPH)